MERGVGARKPARSKAFFFRPDALTPFPLTHPPAPRPYLTHLTSDPPSTSSPSLGGAITVDADGAPAPAFALAYNAVYCGTRLLAVAGEDGYVSIVDTGAALPRNLCYGGGGGGDTTAPTPRAQWLCHDNAVFDVAWTRGDTRLLTGSGDASVGVWDTLDAARVARAKGHAGSVKAVAPHPATPSLFASGGRDGALLLWDARVGGSSGSDLAPTARVDDAHGALPRGGRRRGAPPPPHSVTAVTWLPCSGGDHLIASGGADGAVRCWDVRALRPRRPGSAAASTTTTALHPVAEIWPLAPRAAGVCGLAVHAPTGSLAAVLAGAGVALLHASLAGPAVVLPLENDAPAAAAAAGAPSSFYVKATFSGDGDALVTGGGDGVARVWRLGRGGASGPAARLTGHSAEVTAVAWCPSDPREIVTASDDATVRVWRVGAGGPPSPQRKAPPRRCWRAERARHDPPLRLVQAAAPPLPPPSVTPSLPSSRARTPLAPLAGVATPAQTGVGRSAAATTASAVPPPPSTRRVRMAQRSLFEFLGPAAAAAARSASQRLAAAAGDEHAGAEGKPSDASQDGREEGVAMAT